MKFTIFTDSLIQNDDDDDDNDEDKEEVEVLEEDGGQMKSDNINENDEEDNIKQNTK